MNYELIYYVVKTSHLWWVIVYRQFHNYDGVIFSYCHVFDSNYRLPIDTETFLFKFICFQWTGFYGPYSVSNFFIFVTDRIKTYMSKNDKRIFPTIFTLTYKDVFTNFTLQRPQPVADSSGGRPALARLPLLGLLALVLFSTWPACIKSL
jgi:hypothetical protein